MELKKGRASDSVLGQVQRYMGFAYDLAEEGQVGRGAIIAFEDDKRIRRALKVAQGIDLYLQGKLQAIQATNIRTKKRKA